MNSECFTYSCPQCQNQRKATEVAASLPDEVLLIECARRNNRRRQRRQAGPGRPTIVRCPGCDGEMSSSELREHRVSCVRQKLTKIQLLSSTVHLSPKDPDPHPGFSITHVGDTEVEFQKRSNHDIVTVGLEKIAEITPSTEDNRTYIRVLGHISWREEIKRWRFAPSQIGRPTINR